MTHPAGEIRLRRSIGSRCFAGWTFQGILTLAIIINLVLVGIVASFTGAGALLELAIASPVYAVWIAGLTAWARAGSDGVSWRYFRRRRASWAQIDVIEFGGVLRAGLGTSGTPAVLVTIEGKRHTVGPALGDRGAYQVEFARGLIALARANSVMVDVHPDNLAWQALRGS